MESLSKYLTYQQAIKSDTALRLGINNTPNADQIEALREWGIHIYDKVKGKFTKCYTTNVFRCDELNEAVGGALQSQHKKGEAGDIDSPSNVYNLEIFKWVLKNVHFDQMIAEFPDANGPSWLHISYKADNQGLLNREEVLVANGKRTGRGADYTKFTGLESWFK